MTSGARRVALVTGGATGIGRVATDVLAAMGADVVALQRSEAGHGDLAARIRFVRCDVRDHDRVRAVVADVEREYGQVHYLVNSAGVRRDRSLVQLELDEWREVIDTNLTGAFHLCRSVALGMMKHGFGRIINVSSLSGLMGAAGQCNYAASKAALIGLTKSIAREVASFGVTCNAIAPGYVDTAMTAGIPERLKERYRATIPAERFASAGEIASAFRFLAADESSYVNGSVVKIDGGLV